MPNLYQIATKKEFVQPKLANSEIFSILYHDIFDYPLDFSDLIRWKAAGGSPIADYQFSISCKDGYYFFEGKEGLIYKRALHKRISQKKLEIAKRASFVLSLVPGVLMVAVTGSLAMENASDESDIDLMVVTSKGSLWTTRLICLIGLIGQIRRAEDKNQKDKLCLNIWLDESDLEWTKNKNIYTAHEIAQVKPLVNKNETYEKFLYANRWILKYWPNSVKIQNSKFKIQNYNSKFKIFEKLAYGLQYRHMKSKITCEVVTPTRALFHPQNWGKVVLDRLNSYFVE